MDHRQMISHEVLDYLEEVFNIGAGNVAVGLSQLLGCEVNMKIPRVHIVESMEELQVDQEISSPLSGAVMSMVGDINGDIFFLIPEDTATALMRHMEKTYPFSDADVTEQESKDLENSVVLEVGNMVVGVYLTAMGRVSNLNIYHTVPKMVKGDIRSILKQRLPQMADEGVACISVMNEFSITGAHIQSKSLIVTQTRDMAPLMNSIDSAREMMKGS